MARKRPPPEAVIELKHRLASLPPRSKARRDIIRDAAELYGISEDTVYRALRELQRPKPVSRADLGSPRILSTNEMERYCEIVAALKLRTTNRQGRHISTATAIGLLEDYGVETPQGVVQAPKGKLRKATVNRYLRKWGYDQRSARKPPAAVRFQAKHSNQCWQFDISTSDLKHIDRPSWVDPDRGKPTLYLFSVTDDRSGVVYQEYHCAYGEDTGLALRFLFNAMTAKKETGFPLYGIPKRIYMDNGPVARSHVFQQVIQYLNIELKTHMPRDSDGRRVTARSTGKVERPFRTVKEMHETLYHFHKPETEDEANAWLLNFLNRYNAMDHRSEPHSRAEDWLKNLPPEGVREMCSWERFCAFARAPESRAVSADGSITVDGTVYDLEPDLAGESVVLWWGLFDDELYVEKGEKRYGPYRPSSGPIPLDHYRNLRLTKQQKRNDRIQTLSEKLDLPRAALEGDSNIRLTSQYDTPNSKPFEDPDPFREFTYPTVVAAKQAIVREIGKPLSKLSENQILQIDEILQETLLKHEVHERVLSVINQGGEEKSHAN